MGIHGVKYFISFIDDCSRCVAIECLKTKDQAAEKIKNYVAYLEHQYDMRPKRFRADNGGEYIGTALKQWCEQKGIKLEYMAPHSPEQNGVAEHMNRTLAELACAMMFGTSVSVHLWPEAMRHTSQQTQSSWRWILGDSTKGHILVIRLMYCTLYALGRFNKRTKKLPEPRSVSM